MQRAGKPVHINDTLTNAADSTNPTKYFIPRKSSPQSRTQDLFGPNWNTGVDADLSYVGTISPNTTTAGPTVSGTTDVTWNDGGGNISNYIGDGAAKDQVITGLAKSGARCKSLTIKNTGTDGQDTIMVSFDNGTNYFTLAPGENYSDEISIHYFLVKRAAAGGSTENGVFEAVAVLA